MSDPRTGASGGSLAPKDARKDNKPRPSLIPMDILIEFVLPAYEEGLLKYEKESWRRGFKISELMDAVDRHKSAFFHNCEDYDQEAFEKYNIKKHHLAGAIFSLISALHVLKFRQELDDRRRPSDGDELHPGRPDSDSGTFVKASLSTADVDTDQLIKEVNDGLELVKNQLDAAGRRSK